MVSKNTQRYTKNPTQRTAGSRMILKDAFQIKSPVRTKPTHSFALCLNLFLRYIFFFLFLKLVLHLNRWNPMPGPLPCGLMLLGDHPLQPQNPRAAQITHLCEKNVIEQQLSLWLIFSDIGVGIHPKDFRSWGQRQCLCVFNVAVVLQRQITRSQEVRNQLSCRTCSLKRGNFQYSGYWVDEPVRLDTECFHFLSTRAKAF